MDDMKATYLRVLDYLESEMEDDDVFAWILRETPARGIPEIQVTPIIPFYKADEDNLDGVMIVRVR